MTRRDLRMKYKRETGRTPTIGLEMHHSGKIHTTDDNDLTEYIAWLEDKCISQTSTTPIFVNNTKDEV